ncbi:MAG: hypothetical protein ABIA37_02715 [Candidatus Woesearchaeota archaeon]
MSNLDRLIKFAEYARGLDTKEKIKLILFMKKIKPNAEVLLKINPKNLGEKFEFEELLKKGGLLFSVSNAKSYEEIKKIKGNKILWEIEGTYFVYDLFKSKKDQDNFNRYLELLDKGRYDEGDRIAGKHYGYPKCCVERFIKEKSENFLKKDYSYWDYYKKQQDVDRKFPYLFHRPHSLTCKESAKMNKRYGEELKKASKKIYKEYVSKGKFKGSLIVGELSDIEVKGKSIWPNKTGHEYELIFKKPFRSNYYLVSFLSKEKYVKGQVLKGEVILQYDYAKTKIIRKKDKIVAGLHHERTLPLLGEVTIR